VHDLFERMGVHAHHRLPSVSIHSNRDAVSNAARAAFLRLMATPPEIGAQAATAYVPPVGWDAHCEWADPLPLPADDWRPLVTVAFPGSQVAISPPEMPPREVLGQSSGAVLVLA
jgi:hypothetical protein